MPRRSEKRLQQDIFQWHWRHCPSERGLLFMVNNEGVDKISHAILKSIGLVPGVSDMIYLNPRTGRAMFLELKTLEGKPTEAQIKWKETIAKWGFYEYYIIRSLEMAIEVCRWKSEQNF